MRTVFVGASARSGTTFLGSMLGTHPRALATPESKFNVEAYLACARWSQPVDLQEAYREIKRRPDFPTWGIDMTTVDESEVAGLQSYAEIMHWLVKHYARSIGRETPEIWVDHTPFNIVYAPILMELYPDAKMIHLVRDGRSVTSSVLKVDWGPNTPNAAAYWWINRVAHGLAAESFLGPERIHRVRYEDLVLYPQTTLQSLCEFLEIEFEPSMVTGSGFRMPKHAAHIHPHVGSAPNADRINAWQRELTPRQIEIFESIAGQFLACLGYELRFGLHARPVSGVEMAKLAIQEIYLDMIGNRLKRRPAARTKERSASPNPVPVP